MEKGKNGIILSKCALIEEYILKLNGYGPFTEDQISGDWGLQKIIERSLQVMVEAMIDCAERICSRNGIGPQTTSADAIRRLKDLGVISGEEPFVSMVRFRNLIVHNYDSLDTSIMYDIVSKRLDDFRKFTEAVRNYENNQH
ncbi:MAG: hypothetical protein CVV49_01115 [Spirochaetae bacterium HGW-Spirochaetae-5]|nr:MAG: hypothetical protein CVV49_01115 [Spirochaetae bacterium HGW-Spirochaetae-5]